MPIHLNMLEAWQKKHAQLSGNAQAFENETAGQAQQRLVYSAVVLYRRRAAIRPTLLWAPRTRVRPTAINACMYLQLAERNLARVEVDRRDFGSLDHVIQSVVTCTHKKRPVCDNLADIFKL